MVLIMMTEVLTLMKRDINIYEIVPIVRSLNI